MFLLFFIPLYPKLPLIDITKTWVYIRVEDILVALTVGIFLFTTVKNRTQAFRTPLTAAIVLYWIIGLVSLLFSIVVLRWTIPHFFPHLAVLHYLRRLEYMVVFFLGVASIRRVRDLSRVIIVLALSVFLVDIYAFGQKLGELPAFLTMNEEFAKGLPLYLSPTSRIASTFGGHYDLAAFLAIAITIFVSLILAKTRVWVKALLFVLSSMSFIVLLFTASRVSLVVLIVCIGMVLWWHNKRKWIVPLLIGILVFLPFAARVSERFAKTFRVKTVLYDSRWGSPVGVAVVAADGQVTIEKSASPAVENLPIGSGFIRIPTQPPAAVTASFIVNAVREASWYPTGGERLAVGEELQMALERGHVYFSTQGPVATTSGEVVSVANRFSLERAFVYDISFTTRLQGQWPRAWEALRRNILLGSGYSVLSLAADSDYMRALGETGILGFASFFYIFVAYFLFVRSTGVSPSTIVGSFTIGTSAALVGLLLTAFSVDIFEASKIAYVFWMLMGFTIGGLLLEHQKAFPLWTKTQKILRHPLLFIGVVCFVGFVIFGAGNAYFIGDDFTWLGWARQSYVTDIPSFFTDAAGFFYRPLSKLYYFGAFSLFWFNPQGYISINILLHVVAASLLYLIVKETTKQTILAMVASLVFVIFSVHHENILWISGFSSLAGSASALASVYLFFLFLRRGRFAVGWFVLSLIFSALGLLWYEGMLAMPLAIAAVLIFFGKKRQWWLMAPFIVLIPIYWWIRMAANAVPPSGNYGVRLSTLPFNVIGNTIGYIGMIIVGPYSADFFAGLRSFAREQRVISLAVVVLFGAGVAAVFRRFRWQRIPGVVWFWIAVFFVSLIPYIGLGNISERYAYIASAALVVLGCLGIARLWRFLPSKIRWGRVVLGVVVLAFVVSNWLQLTRAMGQWRAAGKQIDDLLVSVRKKYFPITDNSALIFVGVPFRNGRAWVFPVGFQDAIVHALQSKSIRIYTVGSIAEAREIQASIIDAKIVQVVGDQIYEISGK
ncbi:MAG: Tetratricopeptide repeat protein [Candidatus Gottesmanbacteria bacterium GW2011_GWA2_47_9]|uniref:Tetratricopeptide repeat protein n=2 Tax=Microgenomates group TaxID=1794810 RepID=A0A0G1U3E1_9BACT|nr:MAG: Tetratricopeptide repeat protein [Candidatus Woesebacteria bacterium GW2011_GWA1_43_12]KKU88584.1 MAG: Tetratricopeptide repeat protein [Candidatus Gottesmanbacteria bacterium GW2011_GWA2_47_9]